MIKNKLHNRKIISYALKAGEVLILRIGGSGLSFLFGVAISRSLGADGAGLYFLSFSIMMFASVAGRLGMDGTILRFIAINASKREWGQVKGVFATVIVTSLASTSLIAMAICILSYRISISVFNDADLADPLFWMALSIIPLSLSRLISQALKGISLVSTSEVTGSFIQPAFALLSVFFLFTSLDAIMVSAIYFFSSCFALLIGFAIWSLSAKNWIERIHWPDASELVRSAFPLWISNTVNQSLIPWAPVAVLGLWSSTADVGIFGAAARISNLISVFLVGINSVLAPQFAKLQLEGRQEDIGRLCRHFSLLLTLASTPIFLLIIFGSGWVMALFGEDFRAGSSVLAILAFGQFSAAFCGPVRTAMLMLGDERGIHRSSLASLIVLTALLLILVPLFGTIGAAISATAATLVSNLLPVFFVWRRIGVVTVPGLHLLARSRGEK